MSNLTLTVSATVVIFLFSVCRVHAAKPDNGVGGKVQHSESFWGKWFSRPERVDHKKETIDSLKDKQRFEQTKGKHEQKSNHYFSDLER